VYVTKKPSQILLQEGSISKKETIEVLCGWDTATATTIDISH